MDDDIIANGLELLEHRKQLLQSMSSANTRAADRAASQSTAAGRDRFDGGDDGSMRCDLFAVAKRDCCGTAASGSVGGDQVN